MVDPAKRSPARHPWLALVAALAAGALVEACCGHDTCKEPRAGASSAGGAPSDGGAPNDGSSCPSMSAALGGAPTDACAPPERVCLIASDLPGSIKQADFVPEPSYAARWRSHVGVWRALAKRVGEDPALSAFTTVLDTRLELVDQDEATRRVVVESGDLLRDLRALVEGMRERVGASGLGCSLPPEP